MGQPLLLDLSLFLPEAPVTTSAPGKAGVILREEGLVGSWRPAS